MTGREEHDKETENRTLKLLETAPELIKNYYYSLGRKTAYTRDTYIRHILRFAEYFKGRDLTSLKRSDIDRYMASIQYREENGSQVKNSTSLKNTRLAVIKNFYEFLIDDELVDRNPAARIKPERADELKAPVYMTKAEVKRVKKKIVKPIKETNKWSKKMSLFVNQNLAIFCIGCGTGLRLSSISEINVSDIDQNEWSISVIEKGNRKRKVYLDSDAKEAVQAWLKDRSKLPMELKTDALFVSSRGNRLSTVSISNLVKKDTADLDKNISPHKMRSTAATILYNESEDIYLVQEMLGHNNIANTKRYAAMTDTRRKEGADYMSRAYK